VFSQSNADKATHLLRISDSIYFSNPDSSYLLSCKAESLLINGSDPRSLAKAKMSKGRYMLLKSMLEEAEAEFNGAYNIYRESKDTLGLAKVMHSKSILQERLGNDAESDFLQEESVALNKQIKAYDKVLSGLMNLMYRYTQRNDFYRAEVAVKEIESLEKYMKPADHYFFNQNKGVLAFGKKKYQQAFDYFAAALTVARTEKMIDSEATVLMLLGRAARMLGKTELSIQYLKESEQVCAAHEFDHEMQETYVEFVKTLEEKGDYKEALRYQKLKETLDKRLLDIDKVNRIAALEKKLVVNEKQKEIDIEKINTQDEKSKAGRLVWFLVFVGLLSVLLVFLFVRARNLKNKIQEQHHMVEEKQREILDSIHYAKRIQSALLTSNAYIRKYLDDFFILYKPKDIVSGDFYWALQHEGSLYVAVADCTGHGVPGAFMSMIGINLLGQIIAERKCTNPGLILDILREEIIRNLNGEHATEESRDGIDMVLLRLDLATKRLEFAGANNSVYILNADTQELKEYKGNKMPVGKHTESIDSFTKQTVQLKTGDRIYAFTDGYPDQFGGPKGKKFKYRQLEELIAKNAALPMDKQWTLLDTAFEEWRGKLEQVDDVCIVGIRLQ
jgi:serine phosphatase RsbU (regulator of sigma subunit)